MFIIVRKKCLQISVLQVECEHVCQCCVAHPTGLVVFFIYQLGVISQLFKIIIFSTLRIAGEGFFSGNLHIFKILPIPILKF
jgi:hypothetical protein